MSNVAYIKQKAIEIANNSSHKIIAGVMNQKDVEADCSAIYEGADCCSDFSDSDYRFMDSYLARKQARIERKNNRKAERMARRKKLVLINYENSSYNHSI